MDDLEMAKKFRKFKLFEEMSKEIKKGLQNCKSYLEKDLVSLSNNKLSEDFQEIDKTIILDNCKQEFINKIIEQIKCCYNIATEEQLEINI